MSLRATGRMQIMADEEKPIIAAGGVVYRWRQGRLELLLIKKQGGYWTLPKGRVKSGEDARAAVAREVTEETNITGEVESLVREVSYSIQKRGRRRPKIVTYYLMRAGDGEPRPQAKERIVRVRWFPVRAALRRIRRSRVRAVARDASAMLLGDASAHAKGG